MLKKISDFLIVCAACFLLSSCTLREREVGQDVPLEYTLTKVTTTCTTEEDITVNKTENIETEKVETEIIIPEYIVAATNDNLNFRRADNLDSDIICVIPNGTDVKIIDLNVNSNFYYCEFEGVKGYLSKDYIDIEGKRLVAIRNTDVNEGDVIKLLREGDYIDIYTSNLGYVTSDMKSIVNINLDDFITYHEYIENVASSKDKELLTSFSTTFTSVGNRAYNIELCSSEIDSTIILKGEKFNWHEVVGNTGEEEGYLLAGTYLNGKSSLGYGGGVCQVSSTLYNCVLNLDMEVIERHKHSLPVSYVDYYAGKDATVGDIGAQNLIFKNNTDYDIFIKSYVTDDPNNYGYEIITVEFYKIIS